MRRESLRASPQRIQYVLDVSLGKANLRQFNPAALEFSNNNDPFFCIYNCIHLKNKQTNKPFIFLHSSQSSQPNATRQHDITLLKVGQNCYCRQLYITIYQCAARGFRYQLIISVTWFIMGDIAQTQLQVRFICCLKR